MRYTVTIINGSNETLIYDSASPFEELSLIEPNLHLEADAAGSFEAVIPDKNVANGNIPGTNSPMVSKLATYIRVYQTDSNRELIWSGRVLSVETDFNEQIKMYCEGAMSYLSDTTQLQTTYPENTTPTSVLESILSRHNSRIPLDRRQIHVGTVTMPTDIFQDNPFTVDYGSTLEVVDNLRSKYGGHMRIRYDGLTPHLDWFESYNTGAQNIQSINFGENLLDFTKTMDGSSLTNSVTPLGKTVNNAGSVAIGNEIQIAETDENGQIIMGPEADSLAWGNGYRIVKDSGAAVMKYEEESSYTSTGFWDSGLARDEYGIDSPNTSLEVQPGEVYYINAVAHGETVMYAVTENRLGNNPAYVLSSKAANADRTVLDFYKLTIPESQCGGRLYLNVSAIKTVGTNPPVYLDQLNMSIYRSRKIPEDLGERITLNGLGDGTYKGYLDGENQYISPTPIADGDFVYEDKTYTKTGYSIEDSESISKYGRIEKILSFEDVTDPQTLKLLAADYLYSGQFEAISISVSALDLALLDSTVNSPNVLDPVRVYSEPHHVDLIVPVQERDIPMNDPANHTFDIGYEKTRRMSDTKSWIQT